VCEDGGASETESDDDDRFGPLLVLHAHLLLLL
jgi:hypothetical protein